MTYKNYSDIDFIKDEFFIRWVRKPDRETELFWQDWLASNPEKRKEIEVARKFLEQLKVEDNYKFPRQDFSRIHENIIRFNREQRYREQDRKRVFQNRHVWSLAAIILLLIVSIGTLRLVNDGSPTEEYALTYITKKTVKGTKYSLVLSDGTKVKLNASSILRFPETFAGKKREVYLEGEAFFEVTRDEQKPFLIHTKEVETQVLGTSFNVRAYNDEPEVKVALIEGKVKVRALSGSKGFVQLDPNQMAVYDGERKTFSKNTFDLHAEAGWKDGILSFDKEPLGEVFKELELWYGVDIEVDDEISLTDVYKGEFQNETLNNVLSGIGYASDFEFKIEAKKVKIYSIKQ